MEKKTKDVIFRCDLKIKTTMLFADKCRQQPASVRYESWILLVTLFALVCSPFACVLVCRAISLRQKRTNPLVYYFYYCNAPTHHHNAIQLYIFRCSCLLARCFRFLIAFFVNILKWDRDDTLLSPSCYFPSMRVRCLPSAQMNFSTLFMFSSTRCWWNGKQTPHKKVNKFSIKSLDRLRFFVHGVLVMH